MRARRRCRRCRRRRRRRLLLAAPFSRINVPRVAWVPLLCFPFFILAPASPPSSLSAPFLPTCGRIHPETARLPYGLGSRRFLSVCSYFLRVFCNACPSTHAFGQMTTQDPWLDPCLGQCMHVICLGIHAWANQTSFFSSVCPCSFQRFSCAVSVLCSLSGACSERFVCPMPCNMPEDIAFVSTQQAD